jgi:hypothetical protein
MKQSYFRTPRTSEECTYHSWANPIHTQQGNESSGLDPDSMVTGFCIAGFIFMIVYLLMGF